MWVFVHSFPPWDKGVTVMLTRDLFVVDTQGLLRGPRYSRLLREDVREGFDRYPFGEDGIQTSVRATGKSGPPRFISLTLKRSFHVEQLS